MQVEDQDNNQETQPDAAVEAGLAEISEELFGQGDDDENDKGEKVAGEGPKASGGDDKEPVVQADVSETPPQTDENSAAVQAVGAPKTWNKEELATWATIPKEIQDKLTPILERRENDFQNGISQYKEMADLGSAYDAEVAPYKAILAAEQVDPVQLFRSFAGNHYLLSRGTPEQKVALAADLLSGYKIPLDQLLNYIADNGGVKPPPSAGESALAKRLEQVEGRLTEAQERENAALHDRLLDEINKMADDKEGHPYFDEVAEDITRLFQARQAANLQEAYDKAVYLNPTTRQKEIDRLTAERTSAAEREKAERKSKVTKSTGDQVKTKGSARDGTIPAGSMDDTLEETLAEIKSR